MDNRRLLIFFLVSLVILLGWQWLMPSPVRHAVPASQPAASAAGSEAPAAVAPAAAPPAAATSTPGAVERGAGGAPPAATTPAALAPIAAPGEQQQVIETDDFRATFTNRGAQLLSFRLKRHHDAKGQPLELIRSRQGGTWPFGLVDAKLQPLPLDDVFFAVGRQPDADGHELLRFEYRGPAGNARKVFRVQGNGVLGVEIEASVPGWGLVLGPGIRNPTTKELGSKRQPRQVVHRTAGKVQTLAAAGIGEKVSLPVTGLTWAGVEDNYFMSVFVPESPLAAVVAQPVAVGVGDAGRPYRLIPFDNEDALPATERELPRDLRVVIQPKGQLLTGAAYLGAKDYDRLAKLPWHLEEALQWGIWGFLSRPLLWALLWIHDHVVPNYGWAIGLLTLALRVLLFPLTWSSQRSMQRMQELQPRLQAIRQKYRGKLRDKNGRMDLEAQRKMNEEMQELFRSEGANPYGGCLPMLVQIPVFFALFAMLRSAVELREAPWILWIHDLSEPDPFYILPVLMGASQIYQQKLTPMSGDPMQRRIMQLFPWMFTIFSVTFPAGLVLYWTVNNLVTITQTMALARRQKAEKADAKMKGKKGKRQRAAGDEGGSGS